MRPRAALRLGLAGAAGFAAATLVSCGSSGKGLIPLAEAGPLRADFQIVEQAARSGNGNCKPTQEALTKTQQDFERLPSSVDAGLRERLGQGIANERTLALALCSQPATAPSTGTTTTAGTQTATTTTSTGTTSTETTSTEASTPTQSTNTATTNAGGGTPPGEGEGRGGEQGDGGSGGVPPGQEGGGK